MGQRIAIGKLSDFLDEGGRVFNAAGISLVVARVGNELCAVANKCPHLGLPLGAGKVDGKTITCPFHGSQFDMCSGENRDWVRGVGSVKLPEWSRRLLAMGKQPSPVKTYPIVVEGDQVFVEV
jgi:nitrite reductase/ring-hydroxylating ferredoxin subunit